jgi:hypothetical protein
MKRALLLVLTLALELAKVLGVCGAIVKILVGATVIAMALLAMKARAVVTGNPGCHAHLLGGVSVVARGVRVLAIVAVGAVLQDTDPLTVRARETRALEDGNGTRVQGCLLSRCVASVLAGDCHKDNISLQLSASCASVCQGLGRCGGVVGHTLSHGLSLSLVLLRRVGLSRRTVVSPRVGLSRSLVLLRRGGLNRSLVLLRRVGLSRSGREVLVRLGKDVDLVLGLSKLGAKGDDHHLGLSKLSLEVNIAADRVCCIEGSDLSLEGSDLVGDRGEHGHRDHHGCGSGSHGRWETRADGCQAECNYLWILHTYIKFVHFFIFMIF